MKKKQEKEEKAGMSEFQKYQAKRQERRREKKQKAKEKAKLKKQQGKMSEKQVIQMTEEEKRKRAEYEMLIGDQDKKESEDEEMMKMDSRFKVEGDNDYAIDPTHKEYRKVSLGHNKVMKRPKKW